MMERRWRVGRTARGWVALAATGRRYRIFLTWREAYDHAYAHAMQSETPQGGYRG